MLRVVLSAVLAATSLTVGLAGASANATPARLDADTCTQLRQDHIRFQAAGIQSDMERGPEWARANLSPERLREIELFIQLDEQVKFGCRDARLSADAERAAEAAKALEANPDADPFAPKQDAKQDTKPDAKAKPAAKANGKSASQDDEPDDGGGPAPSKRPAPALKPDQPARSDVIRQERPVQVQTAPAAPAAPAPSKAKASDAFVPAANAAERPGQPKPGSASSAPPR